jgi:hypothetical protein
LAQTEHGSRVSTFPHVEQTVTAAAVSASALASGCISASRFLIKWSAARRAERGPNPGNFASSWISRSISAPTIDCGIV